MNAWEEEGKPFIFGMEKERKLCSIGMQMILIDKKPSHFHFRPPRPRTIFIPKGKNTHKKWYSSCVTKYYLVRCEEVPATALDERKVQKYFGSSISTAAQQCIWKYFHKYFECYPFFLKEWISKDRRDCCYYWNGMIVVAILEVVWLATSLFYTADQDEAIKENWICEEEKVPQHP